MSIRDKLAVWLMKAGQPAERKEQITAAFNTVTVAEWYQRNGYYAIAGFGGYDTYTDRTVSQETALECSAFYAGVKMISEDIGSLPFHLYETAKDRSYTNKATELPLYRTIHNLVNPEVSSGEFVEALTSHALLTGRGLALIQRISTATTRGGELVYLWPWMPSDARMEKDTRGNAVYIHTEGRQEKTYGRTEVFHLKGFGFTGYDGDDIVKRARHTLGLSLASQEYAGRYFANGIHADLFLEHPGVGRAAPGPEGVKLIKQAFREHVGLEHAGEPFVLQEGMKANRQQTDMVKAQLLEQRRFQVLEVCRILRLPPHKLAELDRAIQANIEQQSIEYVVYTLTPWLRRWKDAVYRCLLTMDQQIENRLYAEHDVAGLLRGDFAAQSSGFRSLLEKGVYSINEVRRWLNLNPVEGGDVHLVQLNMQDVIQAAQGLAAEKAVRQMAAKPDREKSSQEVLTELDALIRDIESKRVA